jgi:hypothetical protein
MTEPNQDRHSNRRLATACARPGPLKLLVVAGKPPLTIS